MVAAMLSLETPLAKMLAVVAKHAITVLAHPGTCAADYFRVIEANQLVRSYPYTASAHESRERNLRHRSPEEVMPKDTVVNDFAAADVDAVMGERNARSDKMRTQWGFLVTRQKSVVLPEFVPEDLHNMFVREHMIRAIAPPPPAALFHPSSDGACSKCSSLRLDHLARNRLRRSPVRARHELRRHGMHT